VTLPREPISPTARVSLIVPVRNEERYIEQFLAGLCAQDYPAERLEVILADGQSSDRTLALAAGFRHRLTQLRVVDNPARAKAPALNMCIPLTTGEVILVMDCHTQYPSNYVSGLVNHLRETNADYVGGRVETQPGADTLVAEAIALALSHPFGVGAGTYRTSQGTGEGMAPFGCYRRQLPLVIGGYNERLPRTHDDEFFARIMRHGGVCLVCGDICSRYFTRPTLRSLCAQMFGNGSNHIATLDGPRHDCAALPGHRPGQLVRHRAPQPREPLSGRARPFSGDAHLLWPGDLVGRLRLRPAAMAPARTAQDGPGADFCRLPAARRGWSGLRAGAVAPGGPRGCRTERICNGEPARAGLDYGLVCWCGRSPRR
jgi:hypothetical protein